MEKSHRIITVNSLTTTIPEPATAVALLGGLLMGVGRGRRR